MQLRVKMEELANAQRQEEQQYVRAIKDVLERNILERDIEKERQSQLTLQLEELEKRCRTEYQEKMKTLAMLTSFKESGNTIMMKLKDAMEAVTQKYKQEKQKTAQLQEKLKIYETENKGNNESAEDKITIKNLEAKVLSLRRALATSSKEIKELKDQTEEEDGKYLAFAQN